jgi:hypothetical protein
MPPAVSSTICSALPLACAVGVGASRARRTQAGHPHPRCRSPPWLLQTGWRRGARRVQSMRREVACGPGARNGDAATSFATTDRRVRERSLPPASTVGSAAAAAKGSTDTASPDLVSSNSLPDVRGAAIRGGLVRTERVPWPL